VNQTFETFGFTSHDTEAMTIFSGWREGEKGECDSYKIMEKRILPPKKKIKNIVHALTLKNNFLLRVICST